MSDQYSTPTEFQPVNTQNIQWDSSGQYGTVNYPNQSKMNVFFFVDKKPNVLRTQQEGRPVYDFVPFIKIAPPGEKLNIVVRPVTEADKHNYPMQWNQFCQNRQQIPEGTPIEMAFPNEEAIADNIKGNGIFTVEQMANASGNALDSIMGGQNYQTKCRKYLEYATRGVPYHQHQKDLETANNKIATLEQQLTSMNATMQQFLAAQANNPMMAAQVAAATMAQGRPNFPQPQQVMQGMQQTYNQPVPQVFDAQMAQINTVNPQTRAQPPQLRVVQPQPIPQPVPQPVPVQPMPDPGMVIGPNIQPPQPQQPTAPKRGRPAGSKNKPKLPENQM